MAEQICTPLQWEELRNIWVVQKTNCTQEQFTDLIFEKIQRISESSVQRTQLLKRIDAENVLSKEEWLHLLLYYAEGKKVKEVVSEDTGEDKYWLLRVHTKEVQFLKRKIYALCTTLEDAYQCSYILSNLHYEKEDLNVGVQKELANLLEWLHSWIENASVQEEFQAKLKSMYVYILQRLAVVILIIGGGWIGMMCMS